MKALKLLAIMAIVASSTATADSYVNGYMRQNGTYVQPHYRSDADGSTYNNYSTQGNTNPYTGHQGYENSQPSFQYQQQQPLSTAIQYNAPTYNSGWHQ